MVGSRGLHVDMRTLHIWSSAFMIPGLHPVIVLIGLDTPCGAPGLLRNSEPLVSFLLSRAGLTRGGGKATVRSCRFLCL